MYFLSSNYMPGLFHGMNCNILSSISNHTHYVLYLCRVGVCRCVFFYYGMNYNIHRSLITHNKNMYLSRVGCCRCLDTIGIVGQTSCSNLSLHSIPSLLFIGSSCHNYLWDEDGNAKSNEQKDASTNQSKSKTSSALIQGNEDKGRGPRQTHRAKAVEAPKLRHLFLRNNRNEISIRRGVVPSVCNAIYDAKEERNVGMTRFVDETYEERRDD